MSEKLARGFANRRCILSNRPADVTRGPRQDAKDGEGYNEFAYLGSTGSNAASSGYAGAGDP
jgi:hypothetical protein